MAREGVPPFVDPAARPIKAKRMYDAKWQRESKAHLAAHPLCVECDRLGRIRAATVVDHREPHRGNVRLFWDRSNWQGLCKAHHDAWKQRVEKGGQHRGVDGDGRPTDPRHPWNQTGPGGIKSSRTDAS